MLLTHGNLEIGLMDFFIKMMLIKYRSLLILKEEAEQMVQLVFLMLIMRITSYNRGYYQLYYYFCLYFT